MDELAPFSQGSVRSPATGELTDSRVQALLAAGASGSPVTGRARAWQPPSVEQLQAVLPAYEVTRLIARGGMGAVYCGIQKTLRRMVAIKVLPPGIEDADLQFAARFKHEAQSMAQLSHPNIVAVFDAGEAADGLLYFVMEFVEGTDVGQLIAHCGRLSPEQAVTITMAVCDALAFAHEEGIIHRDIKPSNIMLDKRGRVKVADFGLAKVINMDNTLVTGSNLAMGTPDFIAPEALIPGAKVDQRADLYAVGVMLYQMLTGRIPRGRFDPPSGLVHQVGKGYDAIVDKALQTNCEKRYTTALELKTDVQRMAHQAFGGTQQQRRWAISAKGRVIGCGVSLAILIGGWGLWSKDKRSIDKIPASTPSTNRLGAEAVGSWVPIQFSPTNPALGDLTVSPEGALRMTHGLSLGHYGINMALKARVRRPAGVEFTGLQARVRGPKNVALYFGASHAWLDDVSFPRPRPGVPSRELAPGEGERTPVLLQLAVVGEYAYGWMDGQPLARFQVKEPPMVGGLVIWSMNGEFSEVEVLNLDGLSEAAALKLLNRPDLVGDAKTS